MLMLFWLLMVLRIVDGVGVDVYNVGNVVVKLVFLSMLLCMLMLMFG